MNSKRFSILITDIADAAFAVDFAGRISAWNNCAAELFGLNEAEAIGVKCHEILQCSDEDGGVCAERCVIECMAQDKLARTNFDLRVQTKSGRLWCNLSTLIVSDASEARHAIHIVRPREMRKRLEQALTEFVRMEGSGGSDGGHLVSSRPTAGVHIPLTARELEILKHLAKGHATRTIAKELNISSATVNNHIKHILTKLDAHTRLEAIRHAESAGVI